MFFYIYFFFIMYAPNLASKFKNLLEKGQVFGNNIIHLHPLALANKLESTSSLRFFFFLDIC